MTHRARRRCSARDGRDRYRSGLGYNINDRGGGGRDRCCAITPVGTTEARVPVTDDLVVTLGGVAVGDVVVSHRD